MKKGRADSCILRVHSRANNPIPKTNVVLPKRKRHDRDFYAEFASPAQLNTLDEHLDDEVQVLYPWCPYVRQGGKRRSLRSQLKLISRKHEQLGRAAVFHKPFNERIRNRRQLDPPAPRSSTAVQPPAIATTTTPAAQTLVKPKTIDAVLSFKSKRRLIQIMFEILGSPGKLNEDGVDQWEARDGIINEIINNLGLQSNRSRPQVREVLTYIMDCKANGIDDVDAGKKINASNSGRKTLLRDCDNRRVAKCLHEGFGLQLTRAIINRSRETKVSISTIRQSAKKAFSGQCRNRRHKKTGSKDPNGIWCLARHEFALQLQQQFREGDCPGESMIGITVCKFFDSKLYIGKIVSFDASRKWYTIKYEDGDQEELSFRELRVKEWKPVPRAAVLWLDEKVIHAL